LNVVAYDQQLIKLYVVPVGEQASYSQAAINSAINAIYAQAIVQWDIEWKSFFATDAWKIDGSEVFDDTDADERMDYTAAMKALIRAYKDAAGDIDKQAVYVFLFNGQHVSGLDGYMPFNKQFAFVFTNGNNDPKLIAHNISHEIAHGTFNLRHTFSDKNEYYQSRGATRNLMDYSSSDANGLNKYQWDLIHDPESVMFAWLEDEEEGEVKANTFYWTPAGTPILIPKDAPTILYIDKIKSKEHINGILYAWREDETVYAAKIENGLFKGYYVANAKITANGIDIIGLTDDKFVDATNLKVGEIIPVNSIMYIGNCTKEDVITQYEVNKDFVGETYYTYGRPLITSFTHTSGPTANRMTFDCEGNELKTYGLNFYNTYQTKVPDEAARNELYNIAKLADVLGKTNFEGYLQGLDWDTEPESSNNYFAFCFSNGRTADYSEESLRGLELKLENYQSNLNTLKQKSDNGTYTKEEILAIVNNNFVFGQDNKYLFNAPLIDLSAKQRLNMMKVLIEGAVSGRDNVENQWYEEDIILELLHTAPQDQHKDLLDGVYQQNILFGMIDGFNGRNFTKLSETLVKWIIEVYQRPSDIGLKALIEDKNLL
jgi:hypothetical protein